MGLLPIYHVYPIADTFDHSYDGANCPCNPTVRVEEAPWGSGHNIIILHRSFDNREQLEERGTA